MSSSPAFFLDHGPLSSLSLFVSSPLPLSPWFISEEHTVLPSRQPTQIVPDHKPTTPTMDTSHSATPQSSPGGSDGGVDIIVTLPPYTPPAHTLMGTLGVDSLIGSSGGNLFDFRTVANSLQSGDHVVGQGDDSLVALFTAPASTIDHSLSISGVSNIQLELDSGARLSLDAAGILGAPNLYASDTGDGRLVGALTITDVHFNMDETGSWAQFDIQASSDNLRLAGGYGPDTIMAAPGSSHTTIVGGGLDSDYVGSPGDTLDYSGLPAVDINFRTGLVSYWYGGPDGAHDTISGFTTVIGQDWGGNTVTMTDHQTLHLTNIDVIHGDSILGGDAIVLDAPMTDTVQGFPPTIPHEISIDHVASITGSSGSDVIDLTESAPATIDGGGGADTVWVEGGNDTLSVAHVDALWSGQQFNGGVNDITVTALSDSLSYSLASGSNTLTLDIPNGSTSLTFGGGVLPGNADIAGFDRLVLKDGSFNLDFEWPSQQPVIDGSELTNDETLAVSITGGLDLTVVAGDPSVTGRGADVFHLDSFLNAVVTVVDFDPAMDQLELGTAGSASTGSAWAFGELGPNGPLAADRFIHDSGIFTGGYSATLTPGMNADFDAGLPMIVQDSTGAVYYSHPNDQNGGGYSVVAHLDHAITAANIHLHA